MKTFIQGSLEPSVGKIKRRVKKGKEVSLIATSGTAISLGNLISSDLGQPKQKMHGYKFKKVSLEIVLEKLIKMPTSEIKKIPSLSERRSEIIIPDKPVAIPSNSNSISVITPVFCVDTFISPNKLLFSYTLKWPENRNIINSY